MQPLSLDDPRLSTTDDGLLLNPGALASTRYRSRRGARALAAVLAFAVAAAAALSVGALMQSAAARRAAAAAAAGGERAARRRATRIAFGSCTAYTITEPQTIWTRGVIPAAPDAWVWLGDMYYADNPLLDCNAVDTKAYTFAECACPSDYMRRPPFQCFAGDPGRAALRARYQLSDPDYQAFLEYMCPSDKQSSSISKKGSSSSSGSSSGGGSSSSSGSSSGDGSPGCPPAGSDPARCPRPVLGVYDDHDYGWNNGDGRNPQKHAIKNVFLDALGEPLCSPRRGSATGLQTSYILPSGPSPGDTIRIVLLDQRYDREPLPCVKRRAWCEGAMASPGGHPDAAWCRDLYVDGGPGGKGACCRKDEEWEAWCSQPASQSHPRRRELCDPTASEFATARALLAPDNETVVWLDGGDSSPAAAAPPKLDMRASWARRLEADTSPICEVLGPRQRRWLRDTLAGGGSDGSGGKGGGQPPPLTLVASGSIMAGAIGYPEANGTSDCDGDELGCYRPAQVNLLHTIANTSGCAVILTGDHHFSDIKVIRPGAPAGTNYSRQLATSGLPKPVYQIMASGMTRSTARSERAKCEGTWLEDTVGLRPLGRCSYVPQPAFGMVEVDWARRRVTLSLRDGDTGRPAVGKDGSKQEVAFRLSDCQPVE